MPLSPPPFPLSLTQRLHAPLSPHTAGACPPLPSHSRCMPLSPLTQQLHAPLSPHTAGVVRNKGNHSGAVAVFKAAMEELELSGGLGSRLLRSAGDDWKLAFSHWQEEIRPLLTTLPSGNDTTPTIHYPLSTIHYPSSTTHSWGGGGGSQALGCD